MVGLRARREGRGMECKGSDDGGLGGSEGIRGEGSRSTSASTAVSSSSGGGSMDSELGEIDIEQNWRWLPGLMWTRISTPVVGEPSGTRVQWQQDWGDEVERQGATRTSSLMMG